jgi:hypothetical protein
LALQRAEAEERRLAAQPRVQLVLEHRSGSNWILRNAGGLPASGITARRDNLPYIAENVPANASLAPGEGMTITLMSSGGSRVPAHLWITWDGQDEPVAVAIPPRT